MSHFKLACVQNCAVAEVESGPSFLVFNKGVRLVSWGSQFPVTFEETGAASLVSVATHQTLAFTD